MKMNVAANRVGRNALVHACFDRVANLPFVKNKWIEEELYVQMMRRYAENYSDIHNLISNLTDRSIKSIISKSHCVSSDGSVSDLGYYMRSTRRGKRMRGSGAQSRMFKAFMITDPGQLPPQSNKPCK